MTQHCKPDFGNLPPLLDRSDGSSEDSLSVLSLLEQALQEPRTEGSEGVLKTATSYPNVLVVFGLESPEPNPFLLIHQACWSVATPGSGGQWLWT